MCSANGALSILARDSYLKRNTNSLFLHLTDEQLVFASCYDLTTPLRRSASSFWGRVRRIFRCLIRPRSNPKLKGCFAYAITHIALVVCLLFPWLGRVSISNHCLGQHPSE